MLPDRLAFIDLETTGANSARDRITEIGLVLVEGDRVSTWNTLVNPQQAIPAFIQRLTGIDDAMVAGAPSFAQVAEELAERLRGCLFIAHNARFDYGFIRHEYQRLGRRFRADVLCTVRLSRKLYPEHYKHNLDSLIARHGLVAQDRHRALADADLIWQFWRLASRERGTEALAEAVGQQLLRPDLPPHLDPALLDDLPETPGVYLIHGEQDELLHLGRGKNLRQAVLAHFAGGGRSRKPARFVQEARRIDWRETVGELGAMLLESRLLATLRPTHSRSPRRDLEPCAWRLEKVDRDDYRPRLVTSQELDFGRAADLYGLFGSRREATAALRKIAEAYQLCPAVLGLEPGAKPGRACAALSAGGCKGPCVGREAPGLHSARLMAALAKLKLQPWPYAGAIGLVERDAFLDLEEVHVLDGWRYLGTARDEAQVHALLDEADGTPFDPDLYKLLKGCLDKARQGREGLAVRPLTGPRRPGP